jgi:hypothetical protein
VETNGWPMRPLLALACLALLTAMLAGCAEDPERYPNGVSATSTSRGSTGTVSGTATLSASSTGTSTGPAGNASGDNHPPVPLLEASAQNGSAPLTVNFTLKGSDLDEDELSWTLAFGDGASTNGTEVPSVVPHVYNATGNFTVVYTLFDGQDSANATILIALSANGTGFTAVLTGSQTTPSSPLNSLTTAAGFCGASCCASFNSGQSGVDCVLFELEAGWAGHAFTLVSDEGDPDGEIWAACDPSELFSIEGHLEDGPESGVIPDGAGCFVTWAKDPPATPAYTLTIV